MDSGAVELIGWASSAVLLATIMRQVYTQWKSRSCLGLSKWLFVGQLTASVGYTIYSLLLHNWVFATSNVALLCTAVAGQILYLKNKRHERQGPAPQNARRQPNPRNSPSESATSTTP